MSRVPLLVVCSFLSITAAAAESGKVILPVERWDDMVRELSAAQEEPAPLLPFTPIERSIEGTFQKGLLRATLRARFEVFAGGHLRVPVLDGGASLDDVFLDGRRTSLLREGSMYTVGVEGTGVHEVRLTFYWGEEQDRFARRLRFLVPPGGPTAISVLVPETDIDAKLDHGAVESTRRSGDGTLIDGQMDASGSVDLSWSRRLRHDEERAVRAEASINALLSAGEALINGVAVFDFDILEGETDRLGIELPEGVEVLRVEGPAVLQWQTDAEAGGRLVVLLRYLVEDEARVAVHYQFPVASLDEPVELRIPKTEEDTPMRGHLGVRGPAGLNVEVEAAEAVTPLTLRDMPAELTELSSSPLLLGFRFERLPPRVRLRISRHSEVELATTIIDDLQASTVVIEDGGQVTKLKLRMRNNAAQYLRVELPPGARLTHSLIDGHPIRPAATKASGGAPLVDEGEEGGVLLFPLRQSERIGDGRTRYHVVQSGETLSDISNRYYSDPSEWQRIIDANPGEIYSPTDVYVGQRLEVPASAQVEESSFVIELAYEEKREPLGGIGRRRFTLPALDVEATELTWHLYLPQALMPLTFDGNVNQYSAIRYDPFRRARDYLRRALWMRDAWAGGKYQSILSRRKAIWQREEQKKSRDSAVVLGSFPLVGLRYRFKRELMGDETPVVNATYVTRSAAAPLHWAALIASFTLALPLLLDPGDRRRRWVAGGGLVVLLVLAHYVLGIHRRVLWGIDLALLVAWVRLGVRPLTAAIVARLREPWRWVEALRLRTIAFVVGSCLVVGVVLSFPLLLSTLVAVILTILWRRAAGRARTAEVARA